MGMLIWCTMVFLFFFCSPSPLGMLGIGVPLEPMEVSMRRWLHLEGISPYIVMAFLFGFPFFAFGVGWSQGAWVTWNGIILNTLVAFYLTFLNSTGVWFCIFSAKFVPKCQSVFRLTMSSHFSSDPLTQASSSRYKSPPSLHASFYDTEPSTPTPINPANSSRPPSVISIQSSNSNRTFPRDIEILERPGGGFKVGKFPTAESYESYDEFLWVRDVFLTWWKESPYAKQKKCKSSWGGDKQSPGWSAFDEVANIDGGPKIRCDYCCHILTHPNFECKGTQTMNSHPFTKECGRAASKGKRPAKWTITDFLSVRSQAMKF